MPSETCPSVTIFIVNPFALEITIAAKNLGTLIEINESACCPPVVCGSFDALWPQR
jgi:hypothetical protein